MTPEPTEQYLGEYRLIQLVALKPPVQRWLAEQTGIARMVFIDELPSPDPEQRYHFLANVKAKAAVDHPLVASVYEAVSQEDACFFAHEALPGASLEDRLAANASIRPIDLAHIIRRVAEAQLYIQQAGIATAILELRHIHLDDQGLIRLENLAIQGPRDPDQSALDASALGFSLLPILADAQPGSTRVLTLLEWMRGTETKRPLEWDQIRDVALQIEQQLTQPQVSATPLATRALQKSSSRLSPALRFGIITAIVLIGVGVYLRSQSKKSKINAPQVKLETIKIPTGRHRNPDGAGEEIPAFRISPHEITIREYKDFLDSLANLGPEREKIYDHEDQPADKKDHFPDDWENLLSAAKSNGLWNTRAVTLDTPVVGVDWWDATAYAECRKGRLPTQEEWFAALHHEFSDPSSLAPAGWVSINSASPIDRTPTGLIGMAGSVTEWTRRQATNPANPLGARKWVVIGGSFLIPGSNALTREWVDDRSLRRPDLGFRLVFDADTP